MDLLIDNLDGQGALDYTSAIEAESAPRIRRRLNTPAEMEVSLIGDSSAFLVPMAGARVALVRADGSAVFTGYLPAAPEPEYLGWGEHPVFRYQLHAVGDEFLLDRKQLPGRAPFIHRPAGNVLRELANELLPGAFDLSAIQDLDVLASVHCDAQREWSKHAAEIALRARASYRAHDDRIVFAPVGAVAHDLSEGSPDFDPAALKLRSNGVCLNDVAVTGRMEPKCYVHDYFLADGLTRYFGLSHAPFTTYGAFLLDEEYKAPLSPLYWTLGDVTGAISVSGGKLNVSGGQGDGLTTLSFVEKVELGGGILLQHGEVTFSGASDGVLGGLYPGAISAAGCLAGFRISPSGSQSTIRALLNGAATGTTVTTVAGHRYALATRIYSAQIFRSREIFHSSVHGAGNGRGGDSLAGDVRVVLELRDINPSDPATLAAPSTVLYDGVIAGAPGWCVYAPVNAISLHCSLTFTRARRMSEAEVRSAVPNGGYRTRLVGDFADGCECAVTNGPEVAFYAEYVPVLNEKIVVRYRSRGRSLARVQDPASIATLAHGSDDGVRAAIRAVELPAPRTSADCENAALALLDDGGATWSGEYSCWSDALPAATGDLWPGDTLAVDLPSRAASFSAVVREVLIEVADLETDLSRYRIDFANEAAGPLAFATAGAQLSTPPEISATTETAGNICIADLPAAEVTAVTSTTVTIDAGVDPPAGGGFEVRRSDSVWGAEGDRNLVGRVTTRTFTVTRISREVDLYLRQYDASTPRRYSRYSTALHVDYPL
ncbi:MAG TPA: hypothetical protein VMS96_06515 [Terriglobales bacterium]|nr:hypothetical protein [Terriglobales bacterium]